MKAALFTDRDLGKRFPEILRAADIQVECHSNHFKHDTPDEEWLGEVGRRGWIVVTHDGRIRYKPNELAAVKAHKVQMLLVVGKARFPDLAEAFVATWPRIETFIGGHEPPYIAKVYRPSAKELLTTPIPPGRVELWYPKPQEGAKQSR